MVASTVMPAVVLGAAAVVAPREHRELRARFGAPYDAYAARVPAVLPRLRR